MAWLASLTERQKEIIFKIQTSLVTGFCVLDTIFEETLFQNITKLKKVRLLGSWNPLRLERCSQNKTPLSGPYQARISKKWVIVEN